MFWGSLGLVSLKDEFNLCPYLSKLTHLLAHGMHIDLANAFFSVLSISNLLSAGKANSISQQFYLRDLFPPYYHNLEGILLICSFSNLLH